MEPLLTHFCKESYTLEDLYRRIGLFEAFFESELYQQNTSPLPLRDRFVGMAHEEGETYDVAVCARLPDIVWDFFTRENITGALTQLKKEIELLPVLDVYVPVVFDDAARTHLGEWVRAQMGQKHMLRLHVDAHTVGGCMFAYHDVLHRDTLHSRMQVHKGLVRSILSSYA